jgi:hypothetical protein
MEVLMDQDRLTRCRRCGELKGEALVEDVSKGRLYARVLCLCAGVPCAYCRPGMVRRPISDCYDEAAGEVRHTPWFAYLIPCEDCRRRERAGERLRLSVRSGS